MRIWRRLLIDLRKNLDLYLTLVAAGILVLLDLITGVPRDWFDAVNLAVLSLLVGVLLALRHRVQELADRVRRSYAPSVEIADRKVFPGTLDAALENAKQVDMLGLSLLGVVQGNGECFEQRVRAGCRFRFLMIDPESPAVTTAVGSVEGLPSVRPNIKSDIQNSIQRLEHWLAAGAVEIGFSGYAPAFSLLIVDAQEMYGRIQVELYGYGIPPDARPHFVLTRSHEPWYTFFSNQFTNLWNESRKYEPDH